jgi:hypothetical protein
MDASRYAARRGWYRRQQEPEPSGRRPDRHNLEGLLGARHRRRTRWQQIEDRRRQREHLRVEGLEEGGECGALFLAGDHLRHHLAVGREQRVGDEEVLPLAASGKGDFTIEDLAGAGGR